MKENTSNKIIHQFYSDGFQTHRYKTDENYHIEHNRSIKLIIICFLLVMVSCKAKKQIVVNRVAADTTTKQVNDMNARLDAIRSKQISFTTFSGKAKAKLDIGGNSNDVTLNIRISGNQKIWVSITAIAGIEVARALITPDSILIINRLQSIYVKQPFSYIYKFTGDQVNYKMLESLLVGNAIPELLNVNADPEPGNSGVTLSGNLQGMLYKLILGADLKVTQTNLDDQSAGQSLQVTNNTFIQSGNKVVPSQIDMTSVVKDKKIQVNLHYVKLEFDQPLEYPFSIPARYKEAD